MVHHHILLLVRASMLQYGQNEWVFQPKCTIICPSPNKSQVLYKLLILYCTQPWPGFTRHACPFHPLTSSSTSQANRTLTIITTHTTPHQSIQILLVQEFTTRSHLILFTTIPHKINIIFSTKETQNTKYCLIFWENPTVNTIKLIWSLYLIIALQPWSEQNSHFWTIQTLWIFEYWAALSYCTKLLT